MLQAAIHDVVQAATTPIPPVTDWTATITIILTALGVMLTALGIGIGVLAIVGYRDIKNTASNIATQVAEKKLAEYFENQSFRDKIRGEVLPFKLAEQAEGLTATPYTGEEDPGNASNQNNS